MAAASLDLTWSSSHAASCSRASRQAASAFSALIRAASASTPIRSSLGRAPRSSAAPGLGQALGVAHAHVELVDLGQPLAGGRLGVLGAARPPGRRPELLVQRVLGGREPTRVGVGLRPLDALAQRVVRALGLAQGVGRKPGLVGRGRRDRAALLHADPGRPARVGVRPGVRRRGTGPIRPAAAAARLAVRQRSLGDDGERDRGGRDHDRRQVGGRSGLDRRVGDRCADVELRGRRAGTLRLTMNGSSSGPTSVRVSRLVRARPDQARERRSRARGRRWRQRRRPARPRVRPGPATCRAAGRDAARAAAAADPRRRAAAIGGRGAGVASGRASRCRGTRARAIDRDGDRGGRDGRPAG